MSIILKHNSAILFLTHIITEDIIVRYKRLLNETSNLYDVYFAVDTTTNQIDKLKSLPHGKSFLFDLQRIMEQGYTPLGNRVMYNVNYVLLFFRKLFPKYDYYWVIEYDVEFTGSWNIFFNYFETIDADFVSSHIEHFSNDNANWCWWNRTNLSTFGYSNSQMVKSFNPVYRISARALDYMDSVLKKGVQGHFEVIMPTIIANNKELKVLDLGGCGEYSDPSHPNHFYIKGVGVNNGSMRWRPLFLQSCINSLKNTNLLFHPVK